MRFARSLALSRRALHRHPLRTTLAIVGAAIGASAVVTTVAVGNGAARRVLDRIDAMGRNVLMIYAGTAESAPNRPGVAGAFLTNLTVDDSRAIFEFSPRVVAVAPAQQRSLLVGRGDVSMSATVRGTTPTYETIRNYRTATGHYFTTDDDHRTARVAVIGTRVRDVLFPDRDPIGQDIRVGSVPFRVIGVLERRGLSLDGGATEDDLVLVPLRTALRRVFNVDYIRMVYVQVESAAAMVGVAAEVSEVLRLRHRIEPGQRDDFAIENPRVVRAAELEAAAAFRRLVLGLGTVALGLGGVGILSLMILSVRARRGEVGLRVAVGARRRDVVAQFLLEALVISGAGALVGVAAGWVATQGIDRFSSLPTVLEPAPIAIAFGSTLLIGVLFGAYPAFRAASWRPADMLRAE